MDKANGFGTKAVLALGHVAGLIDMVALPIWVGVLIQYYHYSPERAGGAVTSFLLGVLVASLMLAPRFNSVPRRIAAAGGFAMSGISFYCLARLLAVDGVGFELFVALHVIGGVGVGCGLSLVHGAMGRGANPHRMFGIAHAALGIFALVFLSLVPQAVQSGGPDMLFWIFSGVMFVAAAAMAIGFPRISATTPSGGDGGGAKPTKVPRAAWLIIVIVVCMNLNQSMTLSFVERIGADRGFGVERVNLALMALGFVNLFPGALAAAIQKRLSPVVVGMAGLSGQAVLAMTLAYSTTYPFYAFAASFFVSMAIFTHTFLFGLLSRLDTSGRAVAATPATIMMGSSLGPALGGWLVQTVGYPGLGWAATAIACVGIGIAFQVSRQLRDEETPPLCAEARA